MKLVAAFKLVLEHLKSLQNRTLAIGVAGILVPVLLQFKVDVTPAEVVGWLVLAGTVAATFEKLAKVK